ncbi:enoyl-CoA hydratase/isomerase family protein [Saccharobesus litoralis]|uniref:enoyl-CoA hydratase/isomerase family protein n=1 Tax=Saccharobesus litoralis TaxID=2172099 RepID=UPI00131EF0D7
MPFIQSSIRFLQNPIQNQYYFLEIKLNAPDKLNAQDTQMVLALRNLLLEHQPIEKCIGILLHSDFCKAFCSGGDVKSLYLAQIKNKQQVCSTVKQFFSNEYRLMLEMKNYPKPIICIANGITMGGGMGLLCHSSHKVILNDTKLAMPETLIGFFPDVFASRFLLKTNNNLGVLMAIGALSVKANMAVELGLVDYCLPATSKNRFIQELLANTYDLANIHRQLNQHLKSYSSNNHCFIDEQSSEFWHNRDLNQFVQDILNTSKEHEFACLITKLTKLLSDKAEANKRQSSEWKVLQNNLAYGSPLSLLTIFRQFNQTFANDESHYEFDLNVAFKLCAYGDFQEGVRALLVDKQQDPRWKFKNINDASLFKF